MNYSKNNHIPFVHTFSLETNLKFREAEKIWQTYNMGNIKNGNDEFCVMKFSKNGLRIYFKYRTAKEIQYDKEHAEVKVEWIVTPYKVLYEGQPMGEITSLEEMKQVLIRLHQMFQQIEKETDTFFVKKLKMRRIDITRDILTPSIIYSREIISVCKATQLPYGYHFWIMTEQQKIENNWKEEVACLYKSNSKGIKGKIYDKNQNLQDFGHHPVETRKHKGLLRFEISLSRKCLKKQGLLDPGSSETSLFRVMEQASSLFNTYFLEIFDNGSMLSKSLLEKYIAKEFPTRNKKRTNMLDLNRIYNICRKKGSEFNPEDFPGGDKKLHNTRKAFKELHLSPISLSDDCPYIPSFREIFYGKQTNIFSNYAKNHTRGKELWDCE